MRVVEVVLAREGNNGAVGDARGLAVVQLEPFRGLLVLRHNEQQQRQILREPRAQGSFEVALDVTQIPRAS